MVLHIRKFLSASFARITVTYNCLSLFKLSLGIITSEAEGRASSPSFSGKI